MSDTKKQSFREIFAEMVELGKAIFVHKFVDYKAQDGTVIRTDGEELKPGAKLQVITPDGVMDLPPDMTEIILMVNDVPTKVTIEGGVVKEVAPAEQQAPPADTPAQNMGQDFDGKIADLVGRIEKLEQALGASNQALEAANTNIATANNQITTQNDLNKKLFALIEKLADAPGVEPLATGTKAFSTSKGFDLDAFRKEHFPH